MHSFSWAKKPFWNAFLGRKMHFGAKKFQCPSIQYRPDPAPAWGARTKHNQPEVVALLTAAYEVFRLTLSRERQPEEAALFWPTFWWIAKDLFWLYELFAPAMIAAVFVYVFLTYACVTVKEGRRAGCSSESARGELGENWMENEMFVKMKMKCFSKRKLNVRISNTKIECATLGFSPNCCI